MDLSIKRRSFPSDDQSWLGSAHGTNAGVSVTLDMSTFTKATHYPNGYLVSGLPLSKGANGVYGLAAEGELDGFLLTPTPAPDDTATPVGAAMLAHGIVREAKLPVAVTAAQKTAAPALTFIEEA